MSIYSDFDFNMKRDQTGDVSVKADEESINQSIKNILLTNKGEQFFDMNFGSSINQLLFEKMNPVTEIILKNEIRFALENYEPRIVINNIDIVSDYDALTYNVDIDYVIVKLNTNGNASFTLTIQGL